MNLLLNTALRSTHMRDCVFGGQRRDAVFPCIAQANTITGKNPDKKRLRESLKSQSLSYCDLSFLMRARTTPGCIACKLRNKIRKPSLTSYKVSRANLSCYGTRTNYTFSSTQDECLQPYWRLHKCYWEPVQKGDFRVYLLRNQK